MTEPRALAKADIVAAGGAAAEQVRGGPMQAGQWVKLPAIYKLLLNGAGTATIDFRYRDGTIDAGVEAYTITGAGEEYPYFGAGVYEIRATLTGTATVEIV